MAAAIANRAIGSGFMLLHWMIRGAGKFLITMRHLADSHQERGDHPENLEMLEKRGHDRSYVTVSATFVNIELVLSPSLSGAFD